MRVRTCGFDGFEGWVRDLAEKGSGPHFRGAKTYSKKIGVLPVLPKVVISRKSGPGPHIRRRGAPRESGPPHLNPAF